MKPSIKEILFESYRFAWRARYEFVTLTLVPVILLAALMTAALANQGIAYVLIVLNLLLTQFFAVAWHRRYLAAQSQPVGLFTVFSWHMRHTHYFLYMIGLAAFFMLGVIILSVMLTILFGEQAQNLMLPGWFFPAMGLWFLYFYYLFARLGLALPALAIEQPASYAMAWRLSKGQVLRLMAVLGAITLIGTVFNLGFTSILSRVADAEVGMLERIVIFVASLFYQIVGFVNWSATVTALSIFYRATTANPGVVPYAHSSPDQE